ncbi:hypothetical protein RYG68_004609, partial [Salmonella enterica]|nr:hypothetical protein [Salmonella enterica]ELM4225155.1 hypothetical protein [Salmonella enterica]
RMITQETERITATEVMTQETERITATEVMTESGAAMTRATPVAETMIRTTRKNIICGSILQMMTVFRMRILDMLHILQMVHREKV